MKIESPARRSSEGRPVPPEWNATASDYPRDSCVHQLFEQRAKSEPDKVALVFGSSAVTYRELDERADRLARRLRRAGVGPEVPVGLMVERSLEMIVALAAILKAGGHYVPLDPDDPPERLAFFLEDARLGVLVARRSRAADLPPHRAAVIPVELGETEAEDPAPGAAGGGPEDGATARHLAYVLYTSGSTGRPKGVGVEHRSVVRLVRGNDFADMDGEEVFLQLVPLPFDVSTFEIWGPLLNGGRLVIMPPGPPSLEDLGATLERQRVTTLWLTAGLFHLMVDFRLQDLKGLRQLVAGGDVLSVPHVRRVLAGASSVRMINGYGPTEGTTFTTCYTVDDADRLGAAVPIGRPIRNTRVWVLDRRLCPRPVEAAGELCLGGDGLARGYHARPRRTAASFVPNPFDPEPGGRLYKTGDLASWSADGILDFFGRFDHQVKISGFRVELGEIESVLTGLPEVRQATVLAIGDAAAEKRLVAYVVGADGQTPDAKRLRRALGERFPDYMVPQAFVALPELPLTANDKVDRRALAALPIPVPEGGEASDPRTPTEELLAGIWTEVLGTPRLGREDFFVHLGGHSLQASQVVSRVRQAFGVELPMSSLFERGQLTAVAAEIDGAGRGELVPPLRRGPTEAEPPLSFAQERFWFLDQMTRGTNTYSIPYAVRLEGCLDVAALERFFVELLRRHEVLRAVFPSDHGRPVQRIAPLSGPVLPVVDLGGLAPPAGERELLRLVTRAALYPFDLARGPLVRTALVRQAGDRHTLLVNLHHIVADGWSVGLLVREMNAAYGAFRRRRPSPLPPLSIRYRDFARWQRGWLRGDALAAELDYWRRQLGERLPVLTLPRRGAPSGPAAPRRAVVKLPPELGTALRRLGQARDVTLFVTLLAAYGALLARYSGQSRIVVGTAAANRNRIETEPLLGCFVNTLALPLDLAGDPGFDELLVRVRRVVVGAYAHQDLPFEKLVEDLNPDRRSAQPLFQTFFLLQPRPPELRLAELTARPLQAESTGNQDAKFDLAMGVEDFPVGLFVAFSYNASLYPQPLVERMLADYRRILDRVSENLALRSGRWEDDVTAVRLSELPPSDGELSEVRRLFGAPADGPPADAATDVESARREVTELRAGLSRQLDKLPPALRERFEQRLRRGPATSASSRPGSEGPSPT